MLKVRLPPLSEAMIKPRTDRRKFVRWRVNFDATSNILRLTGGAVLSLTARSGGSSVKQGPHTVLLPAPSGGDSPLEHKANGFRRARRHGTTNYIANECVFIARHKLLICTADPGQSYETVETYNVSETDGAVIEDGSCNIEFAVAGLRRSFLICLKSVSTSMKLLR